MAELEPNVPLFVAKRHFFFSESAFAFSGSHAGHDAIVQGQVLFVERCISLQDDLQRAIVVRHLAANQAEDVTSLIVEVRSRSLGEV